DVCSSDLAKALYYRAPYTSAKDVKPFFRIPSNYMIAEGNSIIEKNKIIDLTDKLDSNGVLHWKAPAGRWTIMRFGSRNNGAITRPAPLPGLGFEADKFDTTAMKAHL